MKTFSHFVVWIDHRSAHVISFNHDEADSTMLKHKGAAHKIHHKAGTMGSGHAHEDAAYFREVAEALAHAQEVLIVGPGEVKQAFKAFLDQFVPAVSRCVAAVETLDHPSDGEILAHARKYFHHADRMLGNAL